MASLILSRTDETSLSKDRSSKRCWVWHPPSRTDEGVEALAGCRPPDLSARQAAEHVVAVLRAAEGRERQTYRALLSEGIVCAKEMFAAKFSDTRGDLFGEQVIKQSTKGRAWLSVAHGFSSATTRILISLGARIHSQY